MSRALLTVAVVLLAAACSDDPPTTPNTPTPPTRTETFSGTLTRNGAVTHPFATAISGTITASLTSLAPDSAMKVSLALGTWNTASSTCQILIANDSASQSSVIEGQITTAGGTFCVRLADVGNVGDPVTYQIQVVHP